MVEFINKVIPDAYHGTSKENADSIVVDRKFLFSKGEDCYLGDGIYFFEAGYEYAKWWGEKRFPNKEIGIILAIIQLGRCLELANPVHVELMELARQEILKEKAALPDEITDAVVINLITTKIDPEIETVRGSIPRKAIGKVFSGSRIFRETHIIICVKKHNNILDFKLI